MIDATYRFPSLISTQAKKYRDKAVLYDRNNPSEKWKKYSWSDVDTQTIYAASALLHLGVKQKEVIAQFSQNRAENLILDFSIFSIGAIMTPIYPTSSTEQVEFIVSDASIKILFVEDQKQYQIAVEVMNSQPTLEQIIVFDNNVNIADNNKAMYYHQFISIGKKNNYRATIDTLRQQYKEKDTASILYTSGTSGNPKGVIMTYEMYHEAMRIHQIRLTKLNDKDISIAFLPLTHIFERAWSYYLLFVGATNYINHYPLDIQQTIKDVRPTLMSAVPRFWEKVYIGIKEVIKNYPPHKLAIVTWALGIGKKHNIDTLRKGKKPTKWLSTQYRMADRLVFSKVKKTLGIENAQMLPAAGAKLSNDINLFFQSIGIPLIYGYGLTESTASVSCYKDTYQIGTVGDIMPDVGVKIDPNNNEILLKGKTITPGYFNNEKANKAAFTEDGWFKTGDAGKIIGNQIVLTERIKDLFKTSNGKYIAPQEIETRLGSDKYIDQIATIGDERNYVTAIIVPNFAELEKFAQEHNIDYKDKSDLIHTQEIQTLISKRIEKRQKGMSNFELIKKFKLIATPFSIETGELTNTLKMRRSIIYEKYKKEINNMYQ